MRRASLGTYAFGFVLVLLLIWAFSYALTEKNPDGIPPTPTSTTPSQPAPLGSSVVPQPSQAASPGVSQNTQPRLERNDGANRSALGAAPESAATPTVRHVRARDRGRLEPDLTLAVA